MIQGLTYCDGGLPFVKYEGAGNDFVILDAQGSVPEGELRDLIIRLCDRRRGVGADGLLLCMPVSEECSDVQAVEHSMRYYNCDGSRASFCGNGARCFAHYLSGGYAGSIELSFASDRGVVRARIERSMVTISMVDVLSAQRHSESGGLLLNTGVPHLAIRVEDVAAVDAVRMGRYWRSRVNPETGGVNVDFYSMEGCVAQMRTYERGVEAETLSCGTGVVATALAAGVGKVRAPGGEFCVEYQGDSSRGWTSVRLTGPTRRVFTGLYIAD